MDDTRKATIVVVHGNKRLDEFMHVTDVFEPFKVLGTITELDAVLTDAGTLMKAIDCIKAGLEEQGDRVSAVFARGEAEAAWADPKVTVLSTGKKWVLMRELLKAYDFRGAHPSLEAAP